jgi:phage tail-like protein
MSSTDLVPAGPGPLAFPNGGPPATVSARAILRGGLPEIYAGSEVTMAFLAALELVADPIGATLDCLPAHFHPDLAPTDVLTALAAWFGVDEVESQPADRRRETLLRAGELGRLRGTKVGLELVVSLFFRDLPIRVEDHGGVTVSTEPGAPPPCPAPSFDVFCDEAIPEDRQLALAQCIERWKPAAARYRLRVKRSAR